MSRNLAIYLCALSALSSSTTYAVRHGSHNSNNNQMRDLFAYPKYEVQFLNDLPLSKTDAERCQSIGIDNESNWLEPKVNSGDSGRRLSDGNDENVKVDEFELIPMNFAHPAEPDGAPYPYLCLMPSKNDTSSQTALIDQLDEVEEIEDELDPMVGWQALSHLDGKCLFTTQGWFTYSYCHNSHIRQFHAAAHPHPHPPGGFVPIEDTKYDAYTLGQVAPGARQRFDGNSNNNGENGENNAKLAQGHQQNQQLQPQQQQNNQLQNLNRQPKISIGSGPSLTSSSSGSVGSRYLVQRWTHGTRCDKTGKPREVEIQIHCSMTTGDLIYMIKELSICKYVLIIYSPYLCSLPGFKNHKEDSLLNVKPSSIKCRQIVDDQEFINWEQEQVIKQQQKLKVKVEELDQGLNVDEQIQDELSKNEMKSLPFSKRPTGADKPPSEQQKPQHHFGLKGPEKMFGDETQDNNLLQAGGDEEEEGEEEQVEIIFEGSDIEDESLKNMLRQALNLLGEKAKSKSKSKSKSKKGLSSMKNNDNNEMIEGEGEGEGEEKQVIFYSWEESEGDDKEPILLDADLVILNENENVDQVKDKEKSRIGLGKKEKNVLEKVVRDFLKYKQGGKSGDSSSSSSSENNDNDNDHDQIGSDKTKRKKDEL
ncbi:uncharacterized protein L201_001661 [Kwoniella dendrophila CBS 6074]|uniref:Protein OS-9 homolog n=1 Tax=Kwoniella dendrophila CBS 6074 TaxID=1295534 RepID=A0AAX4JMZ1_9TREE